MTTDEITIRNIDVALTKVNIQPGDVLLVTVPATMGEARIMGIGQGLWEATGCKVIILRDGTSVSVLRKEDANG